MGAASTIAKFLHGKCNAVVALHFRITRADVTHSKTEIYTERSM